MQPPVIRRHHRVGQLQREVGLVPGDGALAAAELDVVHISEEVARGRIRGTVGVEDDGEHRLAPRRPRTGGATDEDIAHRRVAHVASLTQV
jgi:hypothetical protein